MFKDDRLISILSGIVLMAAIGMIVQRGDVLIAYFRGDTVPVTPADDEFTFVSNDVTRLDVLANDGGVSGGAAAQLQIVEGPACGRAETGDGVLLYSAGPGCTEVQTIRYRLGGEGAPSAVATLRPASEPQRELPAMAESAPPPGDERPALAEAAPGATPAPSSPAPAAPAAPGSRAGGGQVAPGGASPARGPGMADTTGDLALAQPSLAEPSRPVIAPSVPSGFGTGISADDSSGIGLAVPAQPGAPSRALPGGLGATALAPAATDAPDSVAAPAGPAAPGAMRAPTAMAAAGPQIDEPEEDSLRSLAPEGLFGGRGRVATQAAPDPSRPRSTLGLENILALAPSSLRAPSGLAGGPGAAPKAAPHIAIADETPPQAGPAPARLAGTAPSLDANAPPALAPAPGAPGGLQPTATLSLARIDRQVSPSAPLVGGTPSGLDASIPRANPVRIAGGQQDRLALAAPDSGLGDVRSLPRGQTLAPVDTSVPRGLSMPEVNDRLSQQVAVARGGLDAIAESEPEEDAGESGALPAGAGQESRTGVTSADTAGEERLAALPEAAAPCTTPPGITVDPRPAAETTLVVASPCHAGSVAELRYSGVRIAVALDASGLGRIEVLGFEERSPAVLWFKDGTEIEFELPFVGMRRLNRVALVWDLPVTIELHAFEYGAGFGENGHVFVGNRKSYGDVRREGGGYLTTYGAIGGIGQNLQVYSHWQRRGGPGGVVNLKIDYASRQRDRMPGTCGTGPYAAPAFTVLRSTDGQMDRPLNRRLSALACDQVPVETTYLIEAAVRDVIVPGR